MSRKKIILIIVIIIVLLIVGIVSYLVLQIKLREAEPTAPPKERSWKEALENLTAPGRKLTPEEEEEIERVREDSTVPPGETPEVPEDVLESLTP